MDTCFIFGAGTFYGLYRKPRPGEYIIAADAGLRTCQQVGLTPDLLLGDFDSLGQVPDFPNLYQVPVEKDDTDTVLAARVGLSKGPGK